MKLPLITGEVLVGSDVAVRNAPSVSSPARGPADVSTRVKSVAAPPAGRASP